MVATVTIKDNMLVEHEIAVTEELRTAARCYRDAHAANEASYRTEPESDEDGNPYDPPAWLTWYEGHKPLAEKRRAAAEAFAGLLGFDGRAGAAITHPWTLDPAAEAVLDQPELRKGVTE